MQKFIQEFADYQSAHKTGLVFSPNHYLHSLDVPVDNTEYLNEKPFRVTEALKQLELTGLSQRCDFLNDFGQIDWSFVTQAHGEKYTDYLKNLWPADCEEKNLFINDTYYNKNSVTVARYAAQGTLEAAGKVFGGIWKNAFALLRPPGHHAGVDGLIEGYCLINNVVVAAQFLKSKMGAKRIAIIDWDVHHGDSTQKLTYNDPSILFVSIHKFCEGEYYPHKKTASEEFLGDGPGLGFNLNFPLNPQENEVC